MHTYIQQIHLVILLFVRDEQNMSIQSEAGPD
jgi:hypothetical protein